MICFVENTIEKVPEGADPDIIKALNYYKERLEGSRKRQDDFRDLRIKLGDNELERHTILALRAMATKLETTGTLGIYFVKLPCDPPAPKDKVMDQIELTVSYPWGG